MLTPIPCALRSLRSKRSGICKSPRTCAPLALAVLVPLLLLLAPTAARAESPVEGEFAVKVGGEVTNAIAGDGLSFGNPFVVGFGLRAGMRYSGLYIGAAIGGHVGKGGMTAGGAAAQLGAELGYDVKLGADWIWLRPQVGAGLMMVGEGGVVGGAIPLPPGGTTASPPVGSVVADSGEHGYVEPGVKLMVQVGRTWFLAADANLLVVPAGAHTADGGATSLIGGTMHFEGGVKF